MTDPELPAGIRTATVGDVDAIHGLICDLADYERARDQVKATPEQLRAALFGPTPAVFALVAEADGEVVGFALYFLSFSTWEGVHGIYLEDLYVRPDAARHRTGQGAAHRPGGDRGGPRVRPGRVVGAGLEHAVDRVLPPAGRGRRWTSGRSSGSPATRSTWRPRDPHADDEPAGILATPRTG